MLSDEEEKDVDEWDIDMGVYYERDDGDKDARDMMTMRRDVRRREGLHNSQKTIGKFEKHTKVTTIIYFLLVDLVTKVVLYFYFHLGKTCDFVLLHSTFLYWFQVDGRQQPCIEQMCVCVNVTRRDCCQHPS